MPPISIIDRTLDYAKVDFSPSHHHPLRSRIILASVVALAGSLLADAALVAIGTQAFPATKGYVHFTFFEYSRLTVVGVIIACLAWPVITRISSAPQWLLFRLALSVTVVLLLPDVYLLMRGQSAQAVGVLICMHLAIALVTFQALVRLAPVRERHDATTSREDIPTRTSA